MNVEETFAPKCQSHPTHLHQFHGYCYTTNYVYCCCAGCRELIQMNIALHLRLGSFLLSILFKHMLSYLETIICVTPPHHHHHHEKYQLLALLVASLSGISHLYWWATCGQEGLKVSPYSFHRKPREEKTEWEIPHYQYILNLILILILISPVILTITALWNASSMSCSKNDRGLKGWEWWIKICVGWRS